MTPHTGVATLHPVPAKESDLDLLRYQVQSTGSQVAALTEMVGKLVTEVGRLSGRVESAVGVIEAQSRHIDQLTTEIMNLRG